MNFDLETEEGMQNSMAWTKDHLSRVAEGGVWVVPRSGGIYTIHHAKKEVVFSGLIQEPCITRVLEALGWKVI